MASRSSHHPNLVDATHASSHLPAVTPAIVSFREEYGVNNSRIGQTRSQTPTTTTVNDKKVNGHFVIVANNNSRSTAFGGPLPKFPQVAQQPPLQRAGSQSQDSQRTNNPLGAATNGRFNEEWNVNQRGSSILEGPPAMDRSGSVLSHNDSTLVMPSRGGTLKKKASVKRASSVKRSSSRRASLAGSLRSMALDDAAQGQHDNSMSAFYSPVPTSANPTEALANRFSAWRKVLKDLITYFKEIQSGYEHRAKTLLKISNVVSNTVAPSIFMQSGGIDDALKILRSYHKDSIAEANKSGLIENDVILALTGLRSDLSQKIKEIKSLSGDFKNSVDKEMEATKHAVRKLEDAVHRSNRDEASATGKEDPYLLRLAVDRQVERQIDEENYLHQAYLNLETSGRELESIVVGEIQKAYNALAGILKREGDDALTVVDTLRTGPIALPRDLEWVNFIQSDDNFIDPRIPPRQAQNIHYPERDNELATEVRHGLLERKSKYLKSYTGGWYVLSPTHLHEFKSVDKTQAPIMSLYLPEQKLGSHSTEGGSSNKFMLKGRQTGAMHRGHSWVFRAESHDTMMAWYEDIRTLTEGSGPEKTAFVRQHARSVSGGSLKRAASVGSSDGVMDEDDDEPFSAQSSAIAAPIAAPTTDRHVRPQPGGRFPSQLSVDTLGARGLQTQPLSPSSGSSNQFIDRDVAAVAAMPGTGIGAHPEPESATAQLNRQAAEDGVNPYTSQPLHDTVNDAPIALGGAAIGVAGFESHKHNHDEQAANATGIATAAEADRKAETDRATRKALNIDGPDDDNQMRGAIAAQEAATIAAPDVLSGSEDSTLGSFASGGRGQPGLSSNVKGTDAIDRGTVILPQPTFSEDASAIPAAVMLSSIEAEKEHNSHDGLPTSAARPTVDPSTQATYTPPSADATPIATAIYERTTDPFDEPTSIARRTSFDRFERAVDPRHSENVFEEALAPITGGPSTGNGEAASGSRPLLGEIVRAGEHHESVATISDLHIPGQFPKGGSVSGPSSYV